MSLAAAGPSDPILMSFITENRLSRRRWGAGRRLATVLTACVVLASSFVFADDLVNPLAGDSVAAGKGEELFARNCQQCHNSRGKGGKCPQLVRGAWGPGGANSDGFMYRIIAGGRPGTQMGAFGNHLTNEEIWKIVTFLREEARRVKAASAKSEDDDHNW